MRKIITTFVCWLAFAAAFNVAHSQPCEPPQNVKSTINNPNWYNVKLAWDLPDGWTADGEDVVFNNGSIITNPGAGDGGADVSAYVAGQLAWKNIKANSNAVADDFTLTKETILSSFEFYAFQTNSGILPAITKAYLVIYDGDPAAGGKVVWGDLTTDRMESVTFSGIYRTLTTAMSTDITHPLMRIKIKIDDLQLSAGTYWAQIMADGTGTQQPMTIPVMNNDGTSALGNAQAYSFSSNTWSKLLSASKGCAIPFIINGTPINTDVVGYNIYRDNVKLNVDDLVKGRSFLDLVPGKGNYNYEITAMHNDDCESERVSFLVNMPIYPCEVPVDAFPYKEGFEDGVMPACWTQELDGKNLSWQIVTKTTGTPNTTPDNSTYKARIMSSVAAGRGAKSKFVMPMLDISNLLRPALTFNYTLRSSSAANMDTLRVFYKTAATAEWTLLSEYKTSFTGWKEEAISLPDASADYWIAFEASNGQSSYGIMLDAITIYVGDLCPPVKNLGGYIKEQNTAVLTWERADNQVLAHAYNVYRDNVFVTMVDTTTYTDAGLSTGVHNYCIEALYANNCGVSEKECTSFTIATPGTCNIPKDLSSSLHEPEWYNIQLDWKLPDPMGETIIIDDAKLVTDAGAGKDGADVSATSETNGTPGYAMTHSSHYAIADDFTLTKPTFITEMDFFGFVTNSGTTSTFRAINVIIYDGDPSAGGKIVWGDENRNYFKSTEFTGIYRARPSDMKNTERPIMKITATINTELAAGTYWVRYSTSAISPSSQLASSTWAVPISIKGQAATGNARQQMPKDDLHPAIWWQELRDSYSNEAQGIPFIIRGSETFPVGYNLYRDDSLLNANPIKGFTHLDLVPGQGIYTYNISTVWNNGYCESEKSAPHIVDMLETPCITPFEEVYESFEKTKFPPLCWTISGAQSFIRQLAYSGVPEAKPHTGEGMLSFNCSPYSIGTKGSVITPAFSTAKGDYTLSFWMYRDNFDYISGAGRRADSVNIYLSATPDITGLTPLASIHRSSVLSPVVEKEGWYQYRVNLDCSAIPTAAYVIIEGVGMGGNNILIDDIAIASKCEQPAGISVTHFPYEGSFKIGVEWVAPAVSGVHYNLYRDDVLIASNLTETTYTDESGITAGTHTYCVATVCGDYGFESERVCITTNCVIPTFNLTPSAGANGSISPATAQAVNYGEGYTFTYTPVEGYKTSQVLIDGVNVPDSAKLGRYTFTNVTENHTIEVTFEPKVFSITAISGANGNISPAGVTTVSYNGSKAYIITPDTGFKIQDVKIDGESNGDAITNSGYTFTNINVNHLIEATFAAIPKADAALINLTPGVANGELSPAFNANTTQYTLHLPCGENSVNFTASVQPGGTVQYLVNNAPVGMPCTVTNMHTVLTVRSLASDGTTTKDYKVDVIRPFAASQVVTQMWGNVLSVINVPAHNGGYTFTAFQWYENGIAIDGETKSTLYLSKRPNAAASSYTVRLTTNDNITVYTCELSPAIAKSQDMIVFPNPVKAGNLLNVYTYLEEKELKNARIRIYNMQGILQLDVPADYVSSIKAPDKQGMYILQIIPANGENKSFKIIVH